MHELSATKIPDKLICICVAFLAILSVLMIGSTSISTGFFSRSVIVQIVAYTIGFLLFIPLSKFNYSMLEGSKIKLYIASLILLLSVYIPGLGVEQFGARSWINLGVTTVQPSEIVKILFILIMAEHISQNRDQMHNIRGVLKSVLVAAPIILIVLKEDFGSALVFATVWLTMMFVGGVDGKSIGKFLLAVIALIPIAYIFMQDYQKSRIAAFLHPDNLTLSGNYQVWQSKMAIGSGGFFGKGLFSGEQKELEFIPVQTSDFIFSVIGEELGFIGGVIVLAIFAAMLLRMIKISKNSSSLYGSLIVAGVVGMFIFQIFENIAMTMGIMPVTGITLPFLSYGGSSIISNMLAVALVLNIKIYSGETSFHL